MYECITAGVEAVKTFVQIHKWFITMMNDEFPPVDYICGDKTELRRICEERKKSHG